MCISDCDFASRLGGEFVFSTSREGNLHELHFRFGISVAVSFIESAWPSPISNDNRKPKPRPVTIKLPSKAWLASPLADQRSI